MAQLVVSSDTTDQEIEDLWDKLGKLSAEDRRKSLLTLKSQPAQSVPTKERESPVSKSLVYDNSIRRIKVFSGSEKPGNGEADFKHWERAAVSVLEDKDLTEAQKRRLILQSLSGKAEDSIDLFREEPAATIVKFLRSIFGSTADGHELLANFYQIFQKDNQQASEYLNDLFVKLSEVVKAEGLPMGLMPRELLHQFVRGIDDEDLINKLQLEDRLDNPPSFPELSASVRRVESRRTERRLRRKKTVKVNQVEVVEEVGAKSSDTGLEARIQQLEIKLRDSARISAEQNQGQANTTETRQTGRKSSFKGFCFRCGEDGHIASNCNNAMNKQKVELRKNASKGN